MDVLSLVLKELLMYQIGEKYFEDRYFLNYFGRVHSQGCALNPMYQAS